MIPNTAQDATLQRQRLHFAKTVDRLLEQKRWGRSDLARAVGMSRQAISDYMKLRNSPTSRSLNAIADALDVTTEMLWPSSERSLVDLAAERIEDNLCAMAAVPGMPGMVTLTMNLVVPRALALQIIGMLPDEAAEANDNGSPARG